MKRICIFCGSRHGGRAVYSEAARALAVELARRHIGVVYGGGHVGLMGEVAEAALAAGGEVVGVIPRLLLEREVGHAGLTSLHVVESMHERKAMMASLSDAFIALPGGLGTLEELFEVWTWRQLGIHHKPLGLLDVDGFYRPLLGFLDQLVGEGFVSEVNRAQLVCGGTVPELLEGLLGATGARGETSERDFRGTAAVAAPRLHPSTRLTGGLRWGELRGLVAQTVREAQEVSPPDAIVEHPLRNDDEPV